MRGVHLAGVAVIGIAVAATVVVPDALAQAEGETPASGTATAPPPGTAAAVGAGASRGASAPPGAGASASSSASTGAGAATASSSGAAPGEGEEGEPDKPATPSPSPPPPRLAPAMARQPLVTKDGMVRIPGGRFTMGSNDKTAPPNERPARLVVVPPYWIDRTEVTVAAYRACVERGACVRPAKTTTDCTYDKNQPLLPVSCVTWAMANTYCHAVGKRLLAEAEWELAARGTTPIRYPWGGHAGACGAAVTLSRDGTQRSCGGKGPTKVGAHVLGASPFGVHDMSGNVEEWVADWYAEGASESSPRAGASRVLRGGGWMSPPSLARTTSRSWGSVLEAGPNVGFRCGRDD